jgi:tRNA(Ile2) C34 agmatinyltransferase TiaS
MDLEFPNPSIVDVAEPLDGGWLLCPKCGDAWEPQGVEGMARCPKCRVLLSNPLFVARM